MTKAHIKIENLYMRFGKNLVLQNINLEVDQGEYIVILGPTGAGKTTLLKLISGLLKPTKGEIYKSDQPLTNKIPSERRNMAYLPQTSDYSLFPYMNVWENTVFSPKMKGDKTKEEISALGDEILDLVNLRQRYDAFPNELSGGMMQRVALARAIAADAEVFLLDEPLRALDARLRLFLRTELRKLVTDLDKTTFHVTHDQEEAMAVADKVLIINKGKIIQFDNPYEIYSNPNSLFSAYFFGETNLLPARKKIRNKDEIFQIGEHEILNVSNKKLNENLNKNKKSSEEYVITFKADRILVELVTDSSSDIKKSENSFTGTILQTFYLGKWLSIIINVEGLPKTIKAIIPSIEFSKYQPGVDVSLTIPPEVISCFKESWESIRELEMS
ncbi:MAG: ABC transporter ATP-binding protein [Candidatus Hermodarchaeota archaeon]